MQRLPQLCLYLGCIIALALVVPAGAQAQTGRIDTHAAFEAMNAWLSTSEVHGPGWQAYLQVEKLEAELDKGDKADLEVLQSQLDLYSGSASGLREREFTDVRDALRRWIDELKLPAQDELTAKAEEATAELTPIEEEKLTTAKEQLVAAVDSFDRYIERGGEAKAQGWKSFLLFDDLAAELEEESPDTDRVVRTWGLLSGDTPGLSYREFTQLREALRNYLEVAEYFADEEVELANLPAQLKAFRKEASEENKAKLGLTLAWLDQTKQAEDLVAGIRRHYAKPNLFVEVSESLATYGFAEKVDQTDPISNYSNGNSTSGSGHTVADVTASLSPNGSRGQITLHMVGDINSKTRTNNSQGVSFNTKGITTIDATKEVFFTERGLTSENANARCVTDNTNYNLQATSAQVENIARQRIAESERSTEYRAARRAEQKVESDLNSRIGKQIRDANDRMERDFFGPIARRGVEVPYNQYHSTSDTLYQRMILAAPEHLAASNDPPEIKADGDVLARAHASWVNNYADISLRGSLMTDVSLAKALEDWRGEVPEDLQVTEDSEPWDITFASRRPIWLECSKDEVRITLRGQRFTARDRVMEESMHISATYKVQRGGGKISLAREGDVEVTFPDQGDRLPARMIATRNFWRTKFSALFAEEFKELDLNLRGAWETAGPLKLTALGVHPDGWVGLAWTMPEQPAEKPIEESTEEAGAE